MTTNLHATNALLAGVRPKLDEAGQITSLDIDLSMQYSDDAGNPVVGRTVTFNCWEVLSEGQKANMQDIQNTINAHIMATYFA